MDSIASPRVRLPVGAGCQGGRKGKPSAEVEAGCMHRPLGGSQGFCLLPLPPSPECFFMCPDWSSEAHSSSCSLLSPYSEASHEHSAAIYKGTKGHSIL